MRITSTRNYLSGGKRREQTVEAVIKLCARADPATVTTEKIAHHIRVTQGALFRHFPTKDAIWEAVVEWVASRITDRVMTAGADMEDPLQTLEAMFRTHVDFIARHPGVPRVLLGQLQQAGSTPAKRVVRAMLENYRERVTALLKEARAKGTLRSGLSLEAAAIQFVGMVQGLVLQSLIAGKVTRIGELAPAVFEIYLSGIRAEAKDIL
jgi:AcrR family transcriptional regulator